MDYNYINESLKRPSDLSSFRERQEAGGNLGGFIQGAFNLANQALVFGKTIDAINIRQSINAQLRANQEVDIRLYDYNFFTGYQTIQIFSHDGAQVYETINPSYGDIHLQGFGTKTHDCPVTKPFETNNFFIGRPDGSTQHIFINQKSDNNNNIFSSTDYGLSTLTKFDRQSFLHEINSPLGLSKKEDKKGFEHFDEYYFNNKKELKKSSSEYFNKPSDTRNLP